MTSWVEKQEQDTSTIVVKASSNVTTPLRFWELLWTPAWSLQPRCWPWLCLLCFCFQKAPGLSPYASWMYRDCPFGAFNSALLSLSPAYRLYLLQRQLTVTVDRRPALGGGPSRINTQRPFKWSRNWNFHSWESRVLLSSCVEYIWQMVCSLVLLFQWMEGLQSVIVTLMIMNKLDYNSLFNNSSRFWQDKSDSKSVILERALFFDLWPFLSDFFFKNHSHSIAIRNNDQTKTHAFTHTHTERQVCQTKAEIIRKSRFIC